MANCIYKLEVLGRYIHLLDSVKDMENVYVEEIPDDETSPIDGTDEES